MCRKFRVKPNALITTCELFAEIAPEVGKILDYKYNYDEAKRSFAFK